MSEAKARDGKKALEGLKAILELFGIPVLKKQINASNLPQAKMKEANDALDRMMESFAIVQTGRQVQIALAVENKPFEGVNVGQPGLLPRPVEKKPAVLPPLPPPPPPPPPPAPKP